MQSLLDLQAVQHQIILYSMISAVDATHSSVHCAEKILKGIAANVRKNKCQNYNI